MQRHNCSHNFFLATESMGRHTLQLQASALRNSIASVPMNTQSLYGDFYLLLMHLFRYYYRFLQSYCAVARATNRSDSFSFTMTPPISRIIVSYLPYLNTNIVHRNRLAESVWTRQKRGMVVSWVSLFMSRLFASLLNAQISNCAQSVCHLDPVSLVIWRPLFTASYVAHDEGVSLYVLDRIACPLFARPVCTNTSSESTRFVQLYGSIEGVLLHLFSKPSMPD